MKNYLYIFRNAHEVEQALDTSPEEMQAEMEVWAVWMDKLRDQGRYHGGEPLHADGKVVYKSGELITDGPYTEGKEVVGGYLLISAASMDEAIEMSKECPVYRTGGNVEVREVYAVPD